MNLDVRERSKGMKIVGWMLLWLVFVSFGVPMEMLSERSFVPILLWGILFWGAMEATRRQDYLYKINIVLWWAMWFVWSLLGYAFEVYGHEYYRKTNPLGIFFLGAIYLTIFYFTQKNKQPTVSSAAKKPGQHVSPGLAAKQTATSQNALQEQVNKLHKVLTNLHHEHENLKKAFCHLRDRVSDLEKKAGVLPAGQAPLDISQIEVAAKEVEARVEATAVPSPSSSHQEQVDITPQQIVEIINEVKAESQVLCSADLDLAPTKRIETSQEDAAKMQEAVAKLQAEPAAQTAEKIEISIGPVPAEVQKAAVTAPAAVPAEPAVIHKPMQPYISVKPKKAAPRTKPSAASLETFVGEKLLSYVGIAILVLGLAFLLVYSLTRMGPGGRVATGVVCGGVLLALGNWLEKKPIYTLFGRIIMAGGWATVYFTAYGAYHVHEMKVITDPVAGTLMLGIVAAAIVAHTLKYASEPLTGMALLMAYCTLFVSDVTLYTHIAALVIAVLIGIFTWKFRWFNTQLWGIVLLYTGYGIWLYLQGKKSLPQDQGEYMLVTALLVGLWLSFKMADFSKPRNVAYENYMMPILDVMNLFGLALVRKVSHVMFQTTGSPKSSLTLGLVLLVMAQVLRTIDRKRMYRLDSTLGMMLLMVAGWCWFEQYAFCMMSWLALGVIAFVYSLYRDDRYFRDLGHVVMALGTLLVLGGETPKQLAMWLYQFFTGELWLTPGQTSLPSRTAITALASGLVGGLGAILLYTGGFVSYLRAKARKQWENQSEQRRENMVTILATFSMMVAFYKLFTPYQAVFAWIGLGLLIFQYGSLRKEFYLHALSHVIILWSMCCGPALGLANNEIGHTMGLGAIALYWNGYLTYRLSQKGLIKQQESDTEQVMTILATGFMMIATGIRFEYFAGTLTWLALSAFLFYYGIFRRADFIRYLSHLVMIGAAVRGLLPIIGVPGIDDNVVTIAGNWQASRSVISLAFVVALFYMHAFLLNFFRHAKQKADVLLLEECFIATAANIVLFVVLWYTLPGIAVALAYAIAGLVFLECGSSWKRAYLQTHSEIAMGLSAFWLFTVNIGAQGYIGAVSRRLLSSLPVLAIWVYAIGSWQKLFAAGTKTLLAEEKMFPTVLSYLNFAAIVSLIYYEPWAFHDGLGWAIYGFLLLLTPLFIRHCRYALQSLIALSMASFNICAVAGRAIGASSSYLSEHPALVLTPLVLLAAHMLCKVFRAMFETPDKSMAGEGVQLTIMRYARKVYAIIFCVVLTMVATMLAAKPYYSFVWGLEALAFGWYGLNFREKSFRWSALILFGLAVCKIVFYDVFSFTTEEKIVTFIGVGIALLFVSFLYHRLKEQLAKFLLED